LACTKTWTIAHTQKGNITAHQKGPIATCEEEMFEVCECLFVMTTTMTTPRAVHHSHIA